MIRFIFKRNSSAFIIDLHISEFHLLDLNEMIAFLLAFIGSEGKRPVSEQTKDRVTE